MLLHFLHACYYKVEQAKVTIDFYYSYKHTMPEFFENWDINDKDIQDVINNAMYVFNLIKKIKMKNYYFNIKNLI